MSTKVKHRSQARTHGTFRSKGFRWGWHKAESKLLRFERPVSKKELTDEMLDIAVDAIEAIDGVQNVRLATTTGAFLVNVQKLGPASKHTQRFEDLVRQINKTILDSLVAQTKKAEDQVEQEAAARARDNHQPFSNDPSRRNPRGFPATLPTAT